MRGFLFFTMLCLTLQGCSSSSSRAPVADLTSISRTQKIAVVEHKKAAKIIEFNGNFDTYQVKKGDTLYSIAWNLSTDVKTLAKYNNLKSPYTIYQGQVLNLKDNKPIKVQKAIAKSRAESQKIEVNSQSAHQGKQKVKNEVVLKKAKGYSASAIEKKPVTETKLVAEKALAKKKVQEQKVTSWSWPARGKVVESFSASQAGMKGISIANQRGTAIYAATDGEVVYAGSGLRGYGNLIIIKHNYDYLSAYAHNETLLVSEKEQIKKGQKIAMMGDSGTDSVHLHFEIRYRGKSVDPLRYLNKQ